MNTNATEFIKPTYSDNNSAETSTRLAMPRLITVKELANILQCAVQQIYRYTNRGLFDDCTVKIGNSRTLRFNLTKIILRINNGGFLKK